MAVVEGVTEFLPISSTGHLVLAANLMKIPQTEFVKSFEIIIQLGAIMAVAVTVIGNCNREKIKKALIAFIPTGVLGLIFYKIVKTYLLGNSTVTIGALFIGGVFMIIHELKVESGKLKIEDLNRKNLLFIGLIQSISMIPGVSRAMATIFGGMGVGLSRAQATEFSFLLAIPTMAAATGLDLAKSGWSFSANEWVILTAGFLGSMITAWITVKWLLGYVQKHDFRIFGWYRIGLALAYIFLV
jgi:undecaprenyl-diphosphatase